MRSLPLRKLRRLLGLGLPVVGCNAILGVEPARVTHWGAGAGGRGASGAVADAGVSQDSRGGAPSEGGATVQPVDAGGFGGAGTTCGGAKLEECCLGSCSVDTIPPGARDLAVFPDDWVISFESGLYVLDRSSAHSREVSVAGADRMAPDVERGLVYVSTRSEPPQIWSVDVSARALRGTTIEADTEAPVADIATDGAQIVYCGTNACHLALAAAPTLWTTYLELSGDEPLRLLPDYGGFLVGTLRGIQYLVQADMGHAPQAPERFAPALAMAADATSLYLAVGGDGRESHIFQTARGDGTSWQVLWSSSPGVVVTDMLLREGVLYWSTASDAASDSVLRLAEDGAVEAVRRPHPVVALAQDDAAVYWLEAEPNDLGLTVVGTYVPNSE